MYNVPYYPDMSTQLVGIVSMFKLTIFLSITIALLFYIFQAVSLYTISKRRGYAKAWLAFIPIANSFVLGSVSDNINACYGKRTNNRVWLLSLAVGQSFVGIATVLYSVGFMKKIIMSFDMLSGELSPGMEQQLVASTLTLLLIVSVTCLIAIGYSVLTYVSQYKIFADYDRQNATLYIILSIIFGIAPFFMFAVRNKPSASLYFASQSMQQPQQPPQYQPQQPQQYQPQQPQQYQPPQPQQYQPQQPDQPVQPNQNDQPVQPDQDNQDDTIPPTE